MAEQNGLAYAIHLRNQGRREEANTILSGLVSSNPGDIPAWLWLVDLAEDDKRRLEILQQCKQFNPSDPRINKTMKWIEKKISDNGGKQKNLLDDIDDEIAVPVPVDSEMVLGAPPVLESIPDSISNDNGKAVPVIQNLEPHPDSYFNQLDEPIKSEPTPSIKPVSIQSQPLRSNINFSFQWLGIAITLLSVGLILLILIFGWAFRDLISPVLRLPESMAVPVGMAALIWIHQ